MKKWLCCFLALVLLLTSAGAEEVKNWRLEGAVTVSEEMLALIAESDETVAQALADVIGQLSFSTLTTEQGGKFEVYLKDRLLLDVTAEERGEYTYTATSLLPGYVIKEKTETYKEEGDWRQDAALAVEKHLGVPEKGIYQVPRVTTVAFNTHLPIEMDGAAMSAFLQDLMPSAGGMYSDGPAEMYYQFDGMAEWYSVLERSDLYLKGDYYTRKNGDVLLLMRLYLDDNMALDFLYATEGDVGSIVLAPCDAPTSTRIELNIENAMMADELEGLVINMYTYEGAVEMMLASPFLVGSFSQETLQGIQYGTLTLETMDELDAMGMGVTYEAGEEYFRMDAKWLGDDYQNPWMKWNLEGAVTEDAWEGIDLKDQIVLDEAAMLDEAVMGQMEWVLSGSAAQVLINACAAMPDEMAVLTNYLIKLESEMSGLLGGDMPVPVFTDKPMEEEVEEEASPDATPRPLFKSK